MKKLLLIGAILLLAGCREDERNINVEDYDVSSWHIVTPETELSKLLPPGYKLSVNRQYVKVYYANTNEPYRVWTIHYSEGETYDVDGNWISLYREPTMSYVDMRNFGEVSKDKVEEELTGDALVAETSNRAGHDPPTLWQITGAFTNVIKELAESGEICKVLGHAWYPKPHLTLEHDPGLVGIRCCVICGKIQTQRLKGWE